MLFLKKKLGARIQEIRKSKKLTQENLAEMIDMDKPNLSNIECGKKFMTAETLEKIILALNVEPTELFDFNHIKQDDELREEIAESIKSLNTKDLQFISKTIKSLLEYKK